METMETGLFAAFGALMLIVCALSLFMLICMWKVYAKAGKPGWAAIIPIYSFIVLLDIVGKPTWWILLMFVPFVNLYIAIKVTHLLSVSFGRDVGMTLLLIFLPIIGYPILAFGDDEYKGPPGLAASPARA